MQAASYPRGNSIRPSWRVGALGNGPVYKRSGGGRCVAQGELCLFRGGLVGAAVKLSCCPGNKCVFFGNSFSCQSLRWAGRQLAIDSSAATLV